MSLVDVIPYVITLLIVPAIMLVYTIMTELLDLIFNYDKIDKLLLHSDKLNSETYNKQHQINKERQFSISRSCRQEMSRQLNFTPIKSKEGNYSYRRTNFEKSKAQAAKEISDIFKV